MLTLIRFDTSPMGNHSISRKLTTEFVESWQKAHPDGQVVERDLCVLELAPVDAAWVAANHTPEANRSAEQTKLLSVSDSLISELQKADEYVFGVAMHNFAIPATMKLWIDQVVRAGKTFAYSADGAKGLLTGKKATILMASAGVYEPGTQAAAMDFVRPYLRTVFGFMGITNVADIAVGGTAQLMSGKVDSAAFLAPTMLKVQAQARA